MSSDSFTVAGHPALAGCAHVDAVLDDLLGVRPSASETDEPGHDSPSSSFAGGTDAHGGCAAGLRTEAPSADCGDGLRLWSATDIQLVELVRSADALAARVAGMRAQAVAECSRRDLPARTAATGGTAWLAGTLNARPSRAKSIWKTALALDTAAPGTKAALCAGAVDEDQASVIAGAMAALPADVPTEVRAGGERFLLDQAATLNAYSLSHLGNRLLDVVAPDLAEAKLAEQLAREDTNAAKVSLTAADDRHGMVFVRGRFDIESWALITAALNPLAAPRPAAPRDGDGDMRGGAVADGSSGLRGAAGDASASLPGVTPLDEVEAAEKDTRSYPHRMADALVELARRALGAGNLPETGRVKPHVVVTIDHAALCAQVGAGLLDTGETLSVSAVRRLACDAQITTILVDGRSYPLDVGRTNRYFDGHLRRALIQRDRGCAFPGCTRPPDWTDGHHIVHWADGGATCLDNGVLLCGHHHRVIHRGEWTVQLGRDKRPWFTPPAWIDPERKPRLNTTHLRL